jgi:hypothetical protein
MEMESASLLLSTQPEVDEVRGLGALLLLASRAGEPV